MTSLLTRPKAPNPFSVGKRRVSVAWPVMATAKYVEATEAHMDASSALHASLVTKIKATRELIYKTQIAAEGGKSRSGCLEVVDGVLTEISERLEGK